MLRSWGWLAVWEHVTWRLTKDVWSKFWKCLGRYDSIQFYLNSSFNNARKLYRNPDTKFFNVTNVSLMSVARKNSARRHEEETWRENKLKRVSSSSSSEWPCIVIKNHFSSITVHYDTTADSVCSNIPRSSQVFRSVADFPDPGPRRIMWRNHVSRSPLRFTRVGHEYSLKRSRFPTNVAARERANPSSFPLKRNFKLIFKFQAFLAATILKTLGKNSRTDWLHV